MQFITIIQMKKASLERKDREKQQQHAHTQTHSRTLNIERGGREGKWEGGGKLKNMKSAESEHLFKI